MAFLKAGKGIPLTVGNVAILLVFTLVGLQVFSLVYARIATVSASPVTVVVVVAVASALSLVVFKKVTVHASITKADLMPFLVTVGIALLVLVVVRDWVPGALMGSTTQLQSVLGFP